MKIKAIIFDLDGVLLDAKEWHYESLNKALAYFGYKQIAREDHESIFDGLPTKKKLEIHALKAGIPEFVFGSINYFKQEFTQIYIEKRCKPIEAQVEAITKLREEGYGMAVCSNSVSKTVETALSKLNVYKYMQFILSNENVKSPKPDSEIYNTAIKWLNVKPWECLVCEDNRNGIESAKNAGTHVLTVSSVYDITYEFIHSAIKNIESKKEDPRIILASAYDITSDGYIEYDYMKEPIND